MGRRRSEGHWDHEFDDLRASLRMRSFGDARNIQHMEQEDLIRLQSRIGLGDEWGVLKYPIEWMPRGSWRKQSRCVINITKRLEIDSANDPCTASMAVTTITRLALILYFVPMQGERVGEILLAPTSMTSTMGYLCGLGKIALNRRSNAIDGLFCRLSNSVSDKILKDTRYALEIRRLLELQGRGYWSDVPENSYTPDVKDNRIDDTAPAATKPGTAKATGAVDASAQEPDDTMPLSDNLVSELGWRAMWFVTNLEPALLDCLTRLRPLLVFKVKSEWGEEDRKQARNRYYARLRRFVASYKWLDPDGHEITELPFAVRRTGRGRPKMSPNCWPPTTYDQLLNLVSVAQTLHLCVTLLSLAGRISEVLSLDATRPPTGDVDRMCIDGKTYKLVFANEGADKQWPLPDFGVQAIRRQIELRHAIAFLNDRADGELAISPHPSGIGSLWAHVKTGTDIDGFYNEILRLLQGLPR